ncbi:MAG: DarT ssDNA thymidine ADP-ribosyltransferase family protein [Pseudomonadota bacterium]
MVIWLTYAVLNRSNEAGSRQPSSNGPAPATPPSANKTASGSVPGKGSRFVSDMQRGVARASEVQRAMRPLDMAISRERSVIESQLAAARSALKLDAFFAEDSRHRSLYDDAHARLSKVLDAEKPEEVGAVPPAGPVASPHVRTLIEVFESIATAGRCAEPAVEPTVPRPDIRAVATRRNIRHLVHFTRVANLPSIMANGLLSVQSAHSLGLAPQANDQLRLDGRPDAVSLSVGWPNADMFYKYRSLHPAERWVVLLLEPDILWTLDCGYCRHNAADKRIRTQPWSALTTEQAFESMFADATEVAGVADGAPSRAAQRLAPGDPTDVQAEVLVRGDIAPAMVLELVFEHRDDLAAHDRLTAGRRGRVQARGGYFDARGFSTPRLSSTA